MSNYLEFSKQLSVTIRENIKNSQKKEIVFICIGVNDILQDVIGPLVGSFLQQNEVKNVYGTLEKTIDGINLKEELKKIQQIHPNAYYIAIDAVTSNELGLIFVKKEGITPRSGIDDTFKGLIVGDMSIQCSTFKIDLKTNKIIDAIIDKKEIIILGQIIADAIMLALKNEEK